jgi:hypothetical protein
MIRPGLYPDMPMAEYLADPCPTPSLSASLIHLICSRSPWHAWTASPRLNPAYVREEADRFDLGTAVHAFILQGASDFVVVDAPDWRTQAAKTQREAARRVGRVPLLREQYDQVLAMAAALMPQLAGFDEPRPFAVGRAEQTLLWQEDGLWCRARLDWLHDSHETIDDLKTVGGSANPAAWSRTLFGMGFDIQAAWYRRGVKAVFGTEAAFRFVLIETDAPHAAAVVALGPDAQDLAEKKIRYGMRVWRECLESDVWPGYPRAIYHADLPPWEATAWGERLYRDTGGIIDDGRPLEELL